MKNTPHPLLPFVAAAVILIGLPANASASPITFTFNGTVTTVNPLLAGTFNIGDSLTGSLTYDSALLDSNANPNVGQYAPLSSLGFTVGSYTAAFVNGSGFVTVTNGAPIPDQLGLRGDVTGATVNGFKPFNLQLSLVDSTGLVFSGDTLHLAFSTSQFTSSQFFFSFTNRADPNDLSSPGTNFTGVQGTFSGSTGVAATVPEPATFTLLVGGLGAITPWLRKKRRSGFKSA
jgi:hypothetical protein